MFDLLEPDQGISHRNLQLIGVPLGCSAKAVVAA